MPKPTTPPEPAARSRIHFVGGGTVEVALRPEVCRREILSTALWFNTQANPNGTLGSVDPVFVELAGVHVAPHLVAAIEAA